MKNLFALPVIISLAIFCSCQRQQTKEERKAEVERQVQERLAAERQAQSDQQLTQREAELDAREKALAEKQRAAEGAPVVEASETPLRASGADTSGNVATASYSTFYRKLEPYGVWRETSSYGYVWQPSEAERSHSWRPYTNGRWAYTDAGWIWISEEPFGWATYHYGRWTRLRNIGWVWVPGDEWAPAWVSWRKSNDYVGWAPLPPEARFDRRAGIRNWADNYYDIGPDQYCFVPTNQFGARRIETAVVPVQRNVTIVNQTTNVTNITYSNTTVVNQGPSYDELRARSQQPIERLRLERQITANVDAETPRAVIRGEVIQVPAPVIARAQLAERPRKVKETVAQTIVERGWEGIADRQAAEKARAKIKSEATPPPDAPPKTFVRPAQATAETSPPASKPALASPASSPHLAPAVPSPAVTKVPTPSAEAAKPGSTPASRVSDRSPQSKDQRKAQRVLRKQERVTEGQQSKSQPGKAEIRRTEASPGQSATAIPVTSPSPTESPRKEEKKKRKRERAGVGAAESPSPTATPESPGGTQQ